MSDDSAEPATISSQLLAYLKLFRIPNVFTAIADVAMGFVFVSGTHYDWGSLIVLASASCLLYTAGMILNDVYDYAVDARDRPHRPLPSGQISIGRARNVGYGMLVAGVALGFVAGAIGPTRPILAWRSGMVALCLATSIVTYDGALKKTLIGPIAMGACRFFNVLLGMSIGATGGWETLLFEPIYFMVAGGIGIYIAGVTWFARTEAKESGRGLLIWGLLVMSGGLALLAYFPSLDTPSNVKISTRQSIWPFVLIVLMFPVMRRCLVAIGNPSPQRVQAAVKQCIFSLVVLDAAIAMVIGQYAFAIGILALLVPMYLLGRWVYST